MVVQQATLLLSQTELHSHVILLVKQQQLLTVQLPIHALARQAIRPLPYLEHHGDAYLPVTQQRQF